MEPITINYVNSYEKKNYKNIVSQGKSISCHLVFEGLSFLEKVYGPNFFSFENLIVATRENHLNPESFT